MPSRESFNKLIPATGEGYQLLHRKKVLKIMNETMWLRKLGEKLTEGTCLHREAYLSFTCHYAKPE